MHGVFKDYSTPLEFNAYHFAFGVDVNHSFALGRAKAKQEIESQTVSTFYRHHEGCAPILHVE
jgi:hypothetical protein